MSDKFGFQQTEIGRGFSVDSLEQMRRFFIEYKGQLPARKISETDAMSCWDTTKHENRHFYTSGCLGEASLPKTDRSLCGRDGSPSRPLDFENGSPSRPFFGTVSRKSLPQSKEAVIEHSEPAKSGRQYKQIRPTASDESLPSKEELKRQLERIEAELEGGTHG